MKRVFSENLRKKMITKPLSFESAVSRRFKQSMIAIHLPLSSIPSAYLFEFEPFVEWRGDKI
jgi:hypothetical protein